MFDVVIRSLAALLGPEPDLHSGDDSHGLAPEADESPYEF